MDRLILGAKERETQETKNARKQENNNTRKQEKKERKRKKSKNLHHHLKSYEPYLYVRYPVIYVVNSNQSTVCYCVEKKKERNLSID